MGTFGKKIAAGFALPFILLVLIGAVSYRSVNVLTETGLMLTHTHAVREATTTLLRVLDDAETGQRGYVITGDDAFLSPYRDAIGEIGSVGKELRRLTADNPRQQSRLDRLEPIVKLKLTEMAKVVDTRRRSGLDAAAKEIATGVGKRAMDEVRGIMAEMRNEETELLKVRSAEGEAAASNARQTIAVGTLLCLILATGAGLLITRTLTRQIGSAVQHVQSSSTELQAAANQQVTGANEQATAMSEITTTINELLATSRQIAESAQRVARVSTDAASAARSGDETVVRTQESVGAIKRQVDVIVAHMIELGRKSQQIGGILELINELAEQTNILAINASIEAAGAGETGRRFGVVADEIRKLADRVGGSTKDIRGLVDDVRSAVNTTVMATEGGSKAVDAGQRQFQEVASSFKQIAGLVVTTTEVAKEIELSTKQQASAIEQVNLAIASVAQTAKESETSSNQTLQTSAQLTALSGDLARLVQARA